MFELTKQSTALVTEHPGGAPGMEHCLMILDDLFLNFVADHATEYSQDYCASMVEDYRVIRAILLEARQAAEFREPPTVS